MSLSDKLRERVSRDAQALYIKDWDETIYVTPLTAGEQSKLSRKHGNWLQDLSSEAMVDLIIMKALDKSGERVLSIEDKPILLKESMSVVSTVAGAIIGTEVGEDHEKN